MQPERTQRFADVVASALECAVAERGQFLNDVCGDDITLREEAESLLLFEEKARELFKTPAYELAHEVDLNGASNPVIGREPLFASEAAGEIVDSGPEPRSPEILRTDRDSIASVAATEEWEPARPFPEKAKRRLEIPRAAASKHVPSRPAGFVWARRGVVIAVALLVVAMAIWLRSALRDAKSVRHQRDAAVSDLARVERTKSFLQRIIFLSDQDFTSVWPVAQKRNVTVTEMLDRIVPQVQTELADEPEVRGEILRTIGKAYASQGQHDAAERNLQAALQTQTAFYGEQNAPVTETMVDLGVLLYRREKFAAAELFLHKSAIFLRKENKTYGGRLNAIKLAYALDQLGSVRFYQGNIKGGREVLEEALQVASRAQPKGRDQSVLTNIKTDLGGLLVLVGDFIRGEPLLRESLAEARAATSIPQWETGTTLQMLGELALARNQPREAGEKFLEAEAIYRETLGENNLYFARNLERRATVLLLENDLPSAEELARKSLAITQDYSPENKLPWTDPMVTLSSILTKVGRLAESEDYLRQTLRICEEQPKRNYAAIGLAKIRLSQLLLSQDRFTEAENLAFEAHNQARQNLEPQDPMRKAAANNLIEIYVNQGKNNAASSVK